VAEIVLVALALTILAWVAEHCRAVQERRAACRHDAAGYVSMDDGGVWWCWRCPDCGGQRPYRVTIPPRYHPDDPKCIRADHCDCSFACELDRSRETM
jgi:hypothetical protein